MKKPLQDLEMDLPRHVPYGMEKLSDYPGPAGLLAQLNSGISISEKKDKIRKAIRQHKENYFGLKPVLIERQRALQEIQSEIENAIRLLKSLEQWEKKLG